MLSKMNNTPKSQHLKLYLKLKHQESIIDRSIEAFLVNSKCESELCFSIKRDIDQFEQERQKLQNFLKQSVIQIYEELKSAKATISTGNIQQIVVENFKRKLQDLWKKIEDFKSHCNHVDNLIGEENNLNTDLGTLMRIIRKHKNLVSHDGFYCKSLSVKTHLQKEDPMKEYDYDDVEDFCTLLAKTGHTGNWSDEDHLLYLKLRQKHKTIPHLVRAIQVKCPDLTKECIINHDAWYRTYLKLREKQKIAVQEWRKRKETERQARLSRASESDRNEFMPEILRSSEQSKSELEKKKEMLKQWKEQKEKVRAAEEERLKNQIRAKTEYKEIRRQARVSRLKSRLAVYKEKKAARQEENCERRRNSEPAVTHLFLQMFRARDQEFFERRRNILLAKMGQSKPNDQPIRCNVMRSGESTLFKETIAWQEKQKRFEEKRERTSQSYCYIKDLPRRSMVSWKSFEFPGSVSSRQR